MAAIALLNATTYIHGFDFTTKTNNITVNAEAEDLDATTFGGNGYRQRIAGLREVTSDHSGFWEGPVDAEAWANLGVADRAVTVAPTGTEGDVAYMFRAGQFSYEQFGDVGDLTPFSISMSGSNAYGIVRGGLAKAKGSVSATGVLGSVVNLGAPLATQYVYAVLHVFSAGTTITVQVQSDTAANFPSATTRGTIGPITAVGGTWLARVAGPFVGETHWRLNVSAITGTFEVAGAIAVQ